MATAHKVMLVAKNRSGQSKVFSFTTTDANTAFLLDPSGGSSRALSSQDCWIADIVHSTQGTCTQDKIYFNETDTGIVLYTPNMLPTVQRILPRNPIFVPAGTMVKIQQLT